MCRKGRFSIPHLNTPQYYYQTYQNGIPMTFKSWKQIENNVLYDFFSREYINIPYILHLKKKTEWKSFSSFNFSEWTYKNIATKVFIDF